MMGISKTAAIIVLGAVIWCAGKYLIVDNWNSPADDFTPIYIAAQLLADGKTGSLYDHHPHLFDIVPPGEFTYTARKIGFAGFLHPYVHIPLAAFLVRPLISIPYKSAAQLLLLLNVLALTVSFYFMVKLFCGEYRLLCFGLAGLAVVYYYPLRYSVSLGQTSPLVFLGIVMLYYLAKSGRETWAGVILGGIISLKITPLLLVPFFMARRKWATALSGAATLLVIGLAGLAAAGWEGNRAFLENLFRLSGVSLASWNNQSLDGFLLRLVHDRSYVSSWQLLALSPGMRLLSWGIGAVLTLLWCKLLLPQAPWRGDSEDLLDFSLTLVLMVLLPPLSWSHYYIVLLFPYGAVVREIIRCTTMPFRGLVAAAVVVSYLCVSLPPTYLGITYPINYFSFLSSLPLLVKLPLTLKSSLGFVGAALLLPVIVVARAHAGKSPVHDSNMRGDGTGKLTA
jgi:hypothetical protein